MARKDKFILKLQGQLNLNTASINDIDKQIQQLETQVKSLKLKVELDEASFNKVATQLKELKNLGLNNNISNATPQLKFDVKNAEQMTDSVTKVGKELDKIQTKFQGTEEDAEKTKLIIEEWTKEGKKFRQLTTFDLASGDPMKEELTITENYEKQKKLKEKQLELEAKEKRNQQELLETFKRQSAIQIQGMKDRNAKFMTKDELANLKEIEKAINALDLNKTRNINQEVKVLKTQLADTNKTFIAGQKGATNFGKAMSTAIEKFSIWMGASTLFFQTLRFFTHGIQYIMEMNKALTEISMVTGMTQVEVKGLALTYQTMAKDMGVLTSEILAGSVEFYRQGLSTIEVMERMETTIKASKIAGVEFKAMAETLTATVNSMNIDIDRASDVFAYLGDATATSYEEIATAFQKVGGTAGALGVQFEKVASWIAVVSAKTRESAESIGTSFNTILARMSNITQNGFDEEDGTKINDVAKALNTVDIELTKADGTFRDFGVIVDEVGGKWDGLNSKQKAYLATTLAGTRQQSRFYNLMNGYTESLELYNESLESSGTTQEKYNLWLEGTEARLNKLKTTATGVWQHTFDSQIIKDAIDMLTAFVSTIDGVISAFGLLPVAFMVLIPILLLLNQKYKELFFSQNMFKKGALDIGNAMKFVKQTFIQARKDMMLADSVTGKTTGKFAVLGETLTRLSATTILTTAKVMLLNTALSFGLGWGIQLVVQGIMYLIQAEEKAIEKTIELKKEFQENQATFSNNVKDLRSLAEEYENLANKVVLTTDEEKRYIELKNKIAEISPEVVKGYDEEGNAIIDKKLKIEELIETLKEQQALEREIYIQNSGEDYERYLDELDEKNNRIKAIQDEMNKLLNGGIVVQESNSGRLDSEIDIQGIKQLKEELQSMEQQGIASGQKYDELKSKIVEYQERINKLQTDMKEANLDDGEFTETIKERFKQLVINSNGYSNVLSELRVEAFEFAEAVRQEGLSLSEADAKVEDYVKKLAQLSNIIQDVKVNKEYDKLVEQFMNGTISALEFDQALSELYNKVAQGLPIDSFLRYFQGSTDLGRNLYTVEEATKAIAESTKELSEELTNLEEIQNKVKDGQSLSYEEMIKLKEQYPQLEKAIIRTSNGWTIEKGAIDKVRESLINQTEVQRQSEITKTENAINQTKKRLGAITKEIESIHTLAEAYKIVAELGEKTGTNAQSISGVLGANGNANYEDYLATQKLSQAEIALLGMGKKVNGVLTKAEFEEAVAQQKEVMALGHELEELNKLKLESAEKVEELLNGNLLGGKNEKSDNAVYDSLLPYQNALEELENQLKKVQALKELTTDNTKLKAYAQEEISIYNKQKEAIRNLAEEYRLIREQQKAKLENQGFVFEGSGDSMMIKNLSNIEGKSKETKKIFDEFIQIQLKSIPELSTRWLQLEKTIGEVNKSIENIDLEILLENAKNSVDNLNKVMDALNYKISLLGKNQTGENIQLLKQRVKLNEQLLEITNQEIAQIREKIKLYADNEERVEELSSRISELISTQRNANSQIFTDIREQQNIMFDAVQDIESKIIDVIRKRNEEERQEFEDTHEEELKYYDEKLNAYKDYINGKIKALDDSYKEEDYNKELAGKQEELKQMQAEMDKLALDDSLASRNKLTDLAQQYSDKQSEIEEMQLDRSRELRKENLEESLDEYEDTIEKRKDQLEDEYKAELKIMEKKHSDAKVFAEARKLLTQGNFEEIEAMLIEHEDKWGEGLSIIGDSIKTNIIDQLQLIAEMLDSGIFDEVISGEGLSGQNPKDSINTPYGMSYSDMNTYVNNKKKATKAYNELGDWGLVNSKYNYDDDNEAIRKKYGFSDSTATYDEILRFIQGYDSGGVNDYTGLAMLHGSKTSSEVIFNASDAKKLYNIVRNLPNSFNMPDIKDKISNMVELYIDNLIKIEGNVDETVIPKIKKASNEAVEMIVNTLKKGGNNRRV